MNDISMVTQVILAVSGVLVPIITARIAVIIKRHVRDLSTLKAIEEFAKSAVVLAEKLGVEDRLTGETKKNFAVVGLQNMLVKAGFKPVDDAILSAEVEKAYSLLKQDIERVYAK